MLLQFPNIWSLPHCQISHLLYMWRDFVLHCVNETWTCTREHIKISWNFTQPRLVKQRASIAVQFCEAPRVFFPNSLYSRVRIHADRLLHSLCPSVSMHVTDCQGVWYWRMLWKIVHIRLNCYLDWTDFTATLYMCHVRFSVLNAYRSEKYFE